MVEQELMVSMLKEIRDDVKTVVSTVASHDIKIAVLEAKVTPMTVEVADLKDAKSRASGALWFAGLFGGLGGAVAALVAKTLNGPAGPK